MSDQNEPSNKRKSPTNNNSVNKVVIPHGNKPFTKYVAERNILLVNPQIAKQVNHLDYFGLNYSTLMGAFIKVSRNSSVKLFDEYVDNLLSTTTTLVKAEISKYTQILKDYEDNGWVFTSSGNPQKITVRIYRHCLNDLADLLIELDSLVTLLNHVEKTCHMKTPAMFANIADWVGIPKQLNSKLLGLTKKLNTKFNFDAKSKKHTDSVNFEGINTLLIAYKAEQTKLLRNVADQDLKSIASEAVVPSVVNLSTTIESPIDSVSHENTVSLEQEDVQSLRNWNASV